MTFAASVMNASLIIPVVVSGAGAQRAMPPAIWTYSAPGRENALRWSVPREPLPLSGLDLNLLVTLRALLQAEGVTAAAAKLGQTQPMVSRSLAVLREAFHDPLLVRSGRLMVRTPRADALLPKVERLLAGVDGLSSVGQFNPETSQRAFRIALPNILAPALVGDLYSAIRQRAPHVRLQSLPVQGHPLKKLLSGELDLMIGRRLDHAEVRARVLLPNLGDLVVLVGPEHPAWDEELTRESWLASTHLLLLVEGQAGRQTAIDRALADTGMTRTVGVEVSELVAALDLVEREGLVWTFSQTLARPFLRSRNLRAKPLPVELEKLQIPLGLCWHEAHHADPGHRWLRDLVVEVASTLLTD